MRCATGAGYRARSKVVKQLFDIMPSYAHHFKQDEVSDCYLVVCLFSEGVNGEPIAKRSRTEACGGRAELARFPAHRIVLFSSE